MFSVPISALPLLEDPPFAVGLALLGTSLGHRTLRWLGAPLDEATALERGVLAAAIGLGLLQYLVFTLGMSGRLTPLALWLSLAILAVLLGPTAWRVLRAIIGQRGRFQSLRLDWMTIGTVILVLVLAGAMLRSLCPPTDPDGLYYHLTAPKRWLQAGRLSYLPTLGQTNLPMGASMLYTIPLAIWSDTAAKLVHYGFGVLSLLAIFALGRRTRGAAVGFCATALWFIGLRAVPTLDASGLFSTAYADLAVTLEVVCAALAWVLWNDSGNRNWLLAAAFCAGFAATFKLTAGLTGLALAVLVAAVTLREGIPPGRAVLMATGFLALSLLPPMPWFLRSWLQTGNPVYLAFADLFPTRDWSPGAAKVLAEYFKYYVWGTGHASIAWSLQFRALIRAVALGLTAVVAGLLLWRWRSLNGRALAFIAAVLLLAGIQSSGFYLRYFVPFLPLILIVLLWPLEARLAASRRAQGAVLGILGINALLFLTRTSWRLNEATIGQAVTVALHPSQRESFLEAHLSVMPLWRYANRTLPPDARLVLPASRPGYYLDRLAFLTEAYYQERIRMDTWEHYLDDLARDEIGYAIVPKRFDPTREVGPGYAPKRNELPFAQRLVQERGTLLAASSSDELYQVRPR